MQPTAKNLRCPRWLLLPAFPILTALLILLIAGPKATAVFETLAYSLYLIPLLLAAVMLGLLLTEPFAKKSCFAASPWPDAYRLITAAALGLGAQSFATLALGTLHLLQPAWIASLIPLAAIIAGYPATRLYLKNFDLAPLKAQASPTDFLLLLAAIPIAILTIATCFPPGSLWLSEGRGYDVLEYHLQLPREYSTLNSTAPLGHNIYSFLPANVEMLYLLLTQTTKTVLDTPSHLFAVYPAQFLHLKMMCLAVAAVALAPLRISRLARIIAALVMLSVPWTLITGSLAYNEAGMLLPGALALGLALRCPPNHRHTALLIGILLGLAVGSKMTAGVFFALPVAAILIVRRNPKALVIATITAAALYSPWAIRAAVYSHGNPIFPIATKILGRGDWAADLAARFDRGHGALTQNRFATALDQSILSSQWSPYHLLWLIAPIAIALALVAARRERPMMETRETEADLEAIAVPSSGAPTLLLILAIQILAWIYLTHIQARFLLPIIVPLALLVGSAMQNGKNIVFIIMKFLIGAGVVVQVICTAFLLLSEAGLPSGLAKTPPPSGGVGAGLGELFARNINLPALVEGAPADGKILLVGNSAPLFHDGQIVYNTVFNPNPLADTLRMGGPTLAAKWLRDQHFNYVLIDWSEIDRLGKTYGYDDAITPKAIDALIAAGIKPVPLSDLPPGLTLLRVAPAK